MRKLNLPLISLSLAVVFFTFFPSCSFLEFDDSLCKACPEVFSIAPQQGRAGDLITIRGAKLGNFDPTRGDNVRFNGVEAIYINDEFPLRQDNSLRVIAPVATSGKVTVNIVNLSSNDESLEQSEESHFQYVKPIINDVIPKEGFAGDTIILTGKFFFNDISIVFNNQTATQFELLDPQNDSNFNSIRTIVPAGAGIGPIHILSKGDTLTTWNTFTYKYRSLVTLYAGTTAGDIENANALSIAFNSPTDVLWDESNGEIYVSDQQNNKLKLINLPNKFVVRYLGKNQPETSDDCQQGILSELNSPTDLKLDNPRALALCEAGLFYSDGCGIVQISNGLVTPISKERKRLYWGMVCHNNEDLYVSDRKSNSITRFKIDGSKNIDTFLDNSSGMFTSPRGMTIWRDTLFFVENTNNNNRVMKVPLNAPNQLSVHAGGGTLEQNKGGLKDEVKLNNLIDIYLDEPRQCFYILEENKLRVLTFTGIVYTLAGFSLAGDITGVDGTEARFKELSGISRLPNGELLLADKGNHKLKKVVLR